MAAMLVITGCLCLARLRPGALGGGPTIRRTRDLGILKAPRSLDRKRLSTCPAGPPAPGSADLSRVALTPLLEPDGVTAPHLGTGCRCDCRF